MVPPRDGCQAPDSGSWLLRKEDWIWGLFVGKKNCTIRLTGAAFEL
jgi:hypothetical protein